LRIYKQGTDKMFFSVNSDSFLCFSDLATGLCQIWLFFLLNLAIQIFEIWQVPYKV